MCGRDGQHNMMRLYTRRIADGQRDEIVGIYLSVYCHGQVWDTNAHLQVLSGWPQNNHSMRYSFDKKRVFLLVQIVFRVHLCQK